MWIVLFGVGPAGHSVENIVGGEVDQSRVHLPAGDGQIPDRERVHPKSRLRFLLGDVHLIVRGGVEHQRRIEARQRRFHLSRVRDIDAASLKARDLEAAIAKHRSQFNPELSTPTENRYSSRLHPFIMNECASRCKQGFSRPQANRAGSAPRSRSRTSRTLSDSESWIPAYRLLLPARIGTPHRASRFRWCRFVRVRRMAQAAKS